MLVEVCLSDLNSAINAVKGGASSIELCVDRLGYFLHIKIKINRKYVILLMMHDYLFALPHPS